MFMANSKVFLGATNITSIKLGLQSGKLYLGEALLYPLEKPIGDAVVTCDSATYNGSAQTAQNIVVTLSGVTLVAGTDYTVTSNTGGTNAGTYPIVITGAGEYTGTTSGTFTINKADSSLSFTVTDLTVGVGETKTNAVTVNAGDGIVTYSSNNTAAVTVNNSGTITGVGVGNATITANISSTNNYNSASTSYTAHCAVVVTTKYNVTDTSNPTPIGYNEYTSGFSAIEIDGVVQPSVVSAYTFSTTGEHTVKYTLTDPTSIGEMAFHNCSGLTSIDIPNNITTIGSFAFTYCTGLTSIDIPNNVTSIGTSAFQGCSGLTSIVIPSGVTSISDLTFYGCTGLTSVSIPSGVTSIGSGAFNFCSGLTSIVIPDSVTSIGGYAFAGCTGLTSINIPSGVTSIGNNAFAYCYSLTSIDIPSGVTSIGGYVCYQCSGLTSVTVNATTPPALGIIAFHSTNNYPIYVPCDSVDTYKAAQYWSSYASRIQAIYAEPITNAVVTCDNATYNGAVQTAQNIAVTLSGETIVANTDYTVTSNTGGTNAGSYTVVVGGVGCYSGTSNGTFTIGKVTPTVTAPTAKVLTYNTQAQELVNAGSTDFGTLKYSLDNSTWSTSVPTATNYGSYTVYYKVDGDSNINSVAAQSVACSINEKQVTATVELSQSTYTYNGSACQPTVTVKDGTVVIDPSEYTVTYSNNVNAGTATVTISDNVGGNYEVIGSTTFTINKVTPTVTAPTAKSVTYNGSSQALVNAASTNWGTLKYSTDGTNYSTAIPSGTTAGSYTVYYKVDGDSNINSVAAQSINVTIAKAAGSVTTAPVNNNYTYNGTARAVASAGSGTGTMYYRLGTSGSFSTTMPTMTDAGSNTLYYYAAASANYEQSSTGSITVSVQKAAGAATVNGVSTTYNGSAIALDTVSNNTGTMHYSTNGTTWSTSIPTATNAGSYTVYWYMDESANYNGIASASSRYVSSTISAKTVSSPTITLSQDSYTYNGSACQPTATVKDGSTTIPSSEYTVSYSNNVNAGTATVTITDKSGGNYTVSGSKTFTINKATGSVSTAPVNNNYTYNGTARAVASAGSGTGTMYYRLGSSGSFSTTMPTMTDAGSNTLYYYAAASTNYEQSSTGSITVSVQKASGSVSTAPTAKSLTYNGNNQTLINAGSGTGTMMYKLGTGSWGTAIPSASTAGSYTVYYKASASTNYNESSSGSVACSIAKANISPTVSISNWTYGGTASNPSVAGNSGSGTVTYYYKLSSDSSWSTTKPSNAGSYNIRADIAATTNYNSGTCTSNFTINKANSSLSFSVTNLTVEIGGTKTNAVTVNAGDGTVTYTSNNTSVVTVNNSGVVTGVNTGNTTISANISSTSNYNSATTSYSASCAIAVTAKFDVTDTTNQTQIACGTTDFIKIEVDGVEMTRRTGYTFSTTGEHTVKYYLSGTSISTNTFKACRRITNINIPNGLTTIGLQAFMYCSSLTSITIPNSVTSIGVGAFEFCSSTISLNIGSGVISIGGNAFLYCTSLNNITVDSNNTVYDSRNNCNALIETSTNKLIVGSNSTVIPNTVISIDSAAFSGYTNFTSIVIPDSVTTIGNSAFQSCSGMTACTIGSGVTSIGNYAFKDCSDLTSMTIKADTPPTLGDSAFTYTNCIFYVPCNSVNTYKAASGWSSYSSRISGYDCPALTAKFNVTNTSNATRIASGTSSFTKIEIDGIMQSNVPTYYTFSTTGEHTVKYYLNGTSIGTNALRGCDSLSSCTIPSGVTSIGDGAFYSSYGLTSIDIPDSVTSIGIQAFEYCRSLTSIDIPSGVTSIGSSAFTYCSSLSSCTIGNGVIGIGKNAFYGCTGLTSIDIPNSVTSIGSGMCSGCISLTSCTIGSGVTNIAYQAFYQCSGLTSIVMPNRVSRIYGYAFAYCSSLTSIDITSSEIDGGAFYKCSGLTSITIGNTIPPNLGGGAFDYTNDCPIIVPTCSLVSRYKSSGGWRNYASRIGSYDCPTLTAKYNVTDTSNPTKIVDNTSCFFMFEVDGVIQSSVPTSAYTFSTTGEHTIKYYLGDTSIVQDAFYECRNITNVIMSNGVTSIGNLAFDFCSSLTSVTMPNSVTSIDDAAFSSCVNLRRINSNIDGVFNLSSGLTTINSSVFNQCYSLTSIVIPNNITSIGEDAFNYCTSLTRLNSSVDGVFNIPSGVTSIGNLAFNACTGLTSVTIGNGVTSIGNNAFVNCRNLESITSNAATAPTIQSRTFQGVKVNGTLYVPIGSSGYDVWMGTGNYYLGSYGWTKVEQ